MSEQALLRTLGALLVCAAIGTANADCQTIQTANSSAISRTSESDFVKIVLKTIASSELCNIRGGVSCDKPLGQYLVKPFYEFKSEYRTTSDTMKAKFCCALCNFITSEKGDWNSLKQTAKPSYVSYQKQKSFANKWWQENCESYNMGWIQHDNFLDEALVDATIIFTWHEAKTEDSLGFSDWSNTAIKSLIRKH